MNLGDKYGRLTCMKPFGFHIKANGKRNARFIYKCDCGNEVIAFGYSVKGGHTKSCGCFKKERLASDRRRDLTGFRFGRLSVVERLSIEEKRTKYKCVCSCGTVKIVLGESLSSGATQSCGCLKSEKQSLLKSRDLSGKRFGLLTVISREPNIKDKTVYKCSCVCGNEINVRSASLTRLYTRSCGCLSKNGYTDSISYSESEKMKLVYNMMRGCIRSSFEGLGIKKKVRSENILGCSPSMFRMYLELKFLPDMNFCNRGKWHIDHTIPASYAENENQLLILNHFLNLCPMWAEDNLRKNDTLPTSVEDDFLDLSARIKSFEESEDKEKWINKNCS